MDLRWIINLIVVGRQIRHSGTLPTPVRLRLQRDCLTVPLMARQIYSFLLTAIIIVPMC